MKCCTFKKWLLLIIASIIIAVALNGAWSIFNAFYSEDDSVNMDFFMKGLGLVLLATTFWMPIQKTLLVVMSCAKKAKVTIESLSKKQGEEITT